MAMVRHAHQGRSRTAHSIVIVSGGKVVLHACVRLICVVVMSTCVLVEEESPRMAMVRALAEAGHTPESFTYGTRTSGDND
jgi:hypothetical protein